MGALMQLLDANILIDYLRAYPDAIEFMASLNPQKTAISAVTLAEVLVGCDHQQQKQVLDFIDPFHFFEIDKNIAISAANLRQQHHWKLPDSFQAAITLEHNLVFVTRNTKDFNPSVHKFVKIPYKLH